VSDAPDKDPLPEFGVELIEYAVNRLLLLDPGLGAALAAAIPGARVVLDIEGLRTRVILRVLPRGIGLEVRRAGAEGPPDEAPPDVVVSGTPLALLRSLGRDADQQMSSGDVRIAGDMRIARRLQTVLAGIEIDIEEPLSRLFGDVAAHQLARAGRGMADWGRMAATRLLEQGVEYGAQETGVVLARAEFEQHTLRIEDLRDDVERLAARVKRAERRRGAAAR